MLGHRVREKWGQNWFVRIVWCNIVCDHMTHFTWSHDTTFHVITRYNISRDHIIQHFTWSHDISRWSQCKIWENCESFILCQSKLVLIGFFFRLGNGAYVIFFNVITINLPSTLVWSLVVRSKLVLSPISIIAGHLTLCTLVLSVTWRGWEMLKLINYNINHL